MREALLQAYVHGRQALSLRYHAHADAAYMYSALGCGLPAMPHTHGTSVHRYGRLYEDAAADWLHLGARAEQMVLLQLARHGVRVTSMALPFCTIASVALDRRLRKIGHASWVEDPAHPAQTCPWCKTDLWASRGEGLSYLAEQPSYASSWTQQTSVPLSEPWWQAGGALHYESQGVCCDPNRPRPCQGARPGHRGVHHVENCRLDARTCPFPMWDCGVGMGLNQCSTPRQNG